MYQYVAVDSHMSMRGATEAKMRVELGRPIENAMSVQLVSFSVANEFFNVTKGSNYIDIFEYTGTGLTRPELLSGSLAIDPMRIVVEPGLYTVEQLVGLLNEWIRENTDIYEDAEFRIDGGTRKVSFYVASQEDSMTPVDEGAEEELPAVPVPTQGTRFLGLWYYQEDSASFQTSIVHRLGFSWEQARGAFEDTFIGGSIVATHSPFETFPFLYLKSDLVTDFQTTPISGDYFTHNISVVAKIPVEVPSFSWIHYNTPINDGLVHVLDGRPIQSFSLELTDHLDRVFQASHFKDFQAILAFKIQSENQRLTEMNLKGLREQMFLKDHNQQK